MTVTRDVFQEEGITFNVLNTSDIDELPYVTLTTLSALPRLLGIYFVVDERNLLYIGKAKSLKTRWDNHHRFEQLSNDYPNCLIHYHPVDKFENLKELEEYFIGIFSPTLNFQPIPRYRKLRTCTEFIADIPCRKNKGERVSTSGYDFGYRDRECSIYGLYGDYLIDILAHGLRFYNYDYGREDAKFDISRQLWLKIDQKLYDQLSITTKSEAKFFSSIIDRLYKDGFIRIRTEDKLVEIALRIEQKTTQSWEY